MTLKSVTQTIAERNSRRDSHEFNGWYPLSGQADDRALSMVENIGGLADTLAAAYHDADALRALGKPSSLDGLNPAIIAATFRGISALAAEAHFAMTHCTERS